MSRIYSSTNRIKFTDIPEKYAIPRSFRGKQSEVHSAVVTFVYDHYKDTKKYRQNVVDALNRLTYCVMQNEPPPFNWVSTNPLETMPDIDIDLVETTLGDFYLTPESIEWNVSPSGDFTSTVTEPNQSSDKVDSSFDDKSIVLKVSQPVISNKDSISKLNQPISHNLSNKANVQRHKGGSTKGIPTPKEDLYIQPPKYPRFDISKVWMSAVVNGDNLVIYTTLPEIPTCQNEVSLTTDVNRMTDSELMALYPNHIIHTRAAELYERYEGIDYDEDIGCIIPIQGFSTDQIRDNIIRYPHLYRLRKLSSEGILQPFFSTIEINGRLLSTADCWDSLPEASIIPKHPEFIKEYVVRRYLLEKDSGMEHKFNIVGGLDPFLTLFMPSSKYVEKGYKDVLSIVKMCVTSRIHYKQARNPILKRMETVV